MANKMFVTSQAYSQDVTVLFSGLYNVLVNPGKNPKGTGFRLKSRRSSRRTPGIL